MIGSPMPPSSRGRDAMLMCGCICLPFQMNWVARVWSWEMMLGGGGDTDAWYQNRERICDFRMRVLPLSDRLRCMSRFALSLAFSSRVDQSAAELSVLIGRITPRVRRGREVGGGKIVVE
jgi:hypothetical protein